MADFQLVVEGDGAARAADELTAILAEGEPSARIARSVATSPSDAANKSAVDPVALVNVILAVPPAVLATIDMVDRISKRKKAEKLIAAARRLRGENHITVTLTGPDGSTWSLDRLEVDTVLEVTSGSNDAR